jgi:hypothetical protein
MERTWTIDKSRSPLVPSATAFAASTAADGYCSATQGDEEPVLVVVASECIELWRMAELTWSTFVWGGRKT